MEAATEVFNYDALVSRVFSLESKTLGGGHEKYLVRYQGRLYGEDSEQSYADLDHMLEPLQITPLFRMEKGAQVIYLISGRMGSAAKPKNWVNLVLFVLTLLSVLLTGAMLGLEGDLPTAPGEIVKAVFQAGWPFAISMIAILGTHEMGHYLMGRRHGVQVTLPYFIPLPFSAFGTMGAFISMKSLPRNRKQLLDIGIAGPLAGLAVAVPVLLIGLRLSAISALPAAPAGGSAGLMLEGNSILYLLLKALMFGQFLPAPANYGSAGPLLYWLRYFFTGTPLPFGGLDVMLHPVAWAGWAGLLVTGLNLIPAGQLDGGHLVYVLLGPERVRKIYPVILILVGVLSIFWTGWLIWLAILFLLGRMHAEPLDQITPLDPKRKTLALIGLGVFLLTFAPVPMLVF